MPSYPARLDLVPYSIEDLRDMLDDMAPAGAHLVCNHGPDSPEHALDTRSDNLMRAGWAARALVAYAEITSAGEAPEAVIGDLLVDLVHLGDALRIDIFALFSDRFHRDYINELAGGAVMPPGVVMAPRYVLLVWFYDHWAVSISTDDKAEAERVQAGYHEVMHERPSFVVDTQPEGA